MTYSLTSLPFQEKLKSSFTETVDFEKYQIKATGLNNYTQRMSKSLKSDETVFNFTYIGLLPSEFATFQNLIGYYTRNDKLSYILLATGQTLVFNYPDSFTVDKYKSFKYKLITQNNKQTFVNDDVTLYDVSFSLSLFYRNKPNYILGSSFLEGTLVYLTALKEQGYVIKQGTTNSWCSDATKVIGTSDNGEQNQHNYQHLFGISNSSLFRDAISSDWIIPSLHELKLILQSSVLPSNFKNSWFASSSENLETNQVYLAKVTNSVVTQTTGSKTNTYQSIFMRKI